MKRTYQPKRDKEVESMDLEKEWELDQVEKLLKLEEEEEEKH